MFDIPVYIIKADSAPAPMYYAVPGPLFAAAHAAIQAHTKTARAHPSTIRSRIEVDTISVPAFQPAISPLTEKIYAIFGVHTATVMVGVAPQTVLMPSDCAAARIDFQAMMKAQSDPAHAPPAPVADLAAPTPRLQVYYRGPAAFSPVERAMAALLRVPYVLVKGRRTGDEEIYIAFQHELAAAAIAELDLIA